MRDTTGGGGDYRVVLSGWQALNEDLVVLLVHWRKRRAVLMELKEQLREEPHFLSELGSITYSIAELDPERAQKGLETEHVQQVKLKERQKFFEEAFQQDMEQYLSTGYLQITERREPIGSMSSMEVNVDMLEQMDLMDMSDHEALDVFLNSGGDDNSVLSPMLGSDSESLPTEITLRVPTQAELRQKLSSLSSASPDTDGAGGSPLIQPDAEVVQADTALVALPEAEAPKDSNKSDAPNT